VRSSVERSGKAAIEMPGSTVMASRTIWYCRKNFRIVDSSKMSVSYSAEMSIPSEDHLALITRSIWLVPRSTYSGAMTRPGIFIEEMGRF
jgi:hypothetical protein